MPVEGVCYAGLEDISKLGQKVLAEHFPTGNDVSETTVSRTYESFAKESWPSLVQDPFRHVQLFDHMSSLAVWRPLRTPGKRSSEAHGCHQHHS